MLLHQHYGLITMPLTRSYSVARRIKHFPNSCHNSGNLKDLCCLPSLSLSNTDSDDFQLAKVIGNNEWRCQHWHAVKVTPGIIPLRHEHKKWQSQQNMERYWERKQNDLSQPHLQNVVGNKPFEWWVWVWYWNYFMFRCFAKCFLGMFS